VGEYAWTGGVDWSPLDAAAQLGSLGKATLLAAARLGPSELASMCSDVGRAKLPLPVLM